MQVQPPSGSLRKYHWWALGVVAARLFLGAAGRLSVRAPTLRIVLTISFRLVPRSHQFGDYLCWFSHARPPLCLICAPCANTIGADADPPADVAVGSDQSPADNVSGGG
jgi:hypothetical protein